MSDKVTIKHTLINYEPGYVVMDGFREVARVYTLEAARVIKRNREEAKRRAERHPMEDAE